MKKSQDPTGPLYAVYGTLRNGWGNHRLLDNEHCTFLGTERTLPLFHMISLGGFPGVIPNGKQEITIEIYEVNSPEVERRLDQLEGYPRFYQKMVIETKWGPANIYILSEDYLKKDSYPIVKSGDWAEHSGRKFINEK